MKHIRVLPILLIFIFWSSGCGKNAPKVLGLFELNKTTFSEMNELIETEPIKTWNEDKQIYEFISVYECDYNVYDIPGTLTITLNENDKIEMIQFKSTLDYGVDMVNYMSDTYGTDFQVIDDITNRWIDGNTTIDLINDDDNVTISWYITE